VVRMGADPMSARTIEGTIVFVEGRAIDFPIVVLWDNKHLTVENEKTIVRIRALRSGG
jgi:hypothetical protein